MREEERLRLKRMLEGDKEELSPRMRQAAIADFKRVAEEYFETDGGFRLETEKSGRGTEVRLTFRIVRAKNFTSLP